MRRDPFAGVEVPAVWDRVLDNVEVTADGCWLWLGAVGSTGYGNISAGIKGRTVLVHRVAAMVKDGELRPGMQVDHRCHDSQRCRDGAACPHRRCVNPEHLAQVTPGRNTRRRFDGALCPLGHPLTTRPDGARRCHTCAVAYAAEYRAGRAGGPRSRSQPGPDDLPLFDLPPPTPCG